MNKFQVFLLHYWLQNIPLRVRHNSSLGQWQVENRISTVRMHLITVMVQRSNALFRHEKSGHFGGHQHRIQQLGRGEGAKKHEIYVATFGGHLFYDLFLQGWGEGGAWPPRHPPGSATGHLCQESEAKFCIPKTLGC